MFDSWTDDNASIAEPDENPTDLDEQVWRAEEVENVINERIDNE